MATDLRFDVSALDRASQTFVKMAAQVERFAKKIDQLDGKKAEVDVEVDTRKADRELGAFATSMRRKLEAAVKALPDIELDADSTPAQRELARVRGEMQALGDKRIGVDIDAAAARAEMERLHAELARLGAESADVQVEADTAAAMAALGIVSGELDKLDGKTAKIKVDVDRSLSDSIVKVAALGRALGAIALPAAAVAAAPQIAAIGGAAVTATGALWLIPAAGMAAGAAVATLAAGFKGFSDALDEDPAKAAEALAKLAPAAREAAQAVRGLAPAWRDMQQAIQQKLFEGVAADLQQLSTKFLPEIQKTLVGIANGFNLAAHETTGFLTSAAGVRSVSTILDNVRRSTAQATGAIEPLTRAFVDIAEVGSTRLPRLAEAFTDVSARFADFIARAKQSGDLGRWIDQGVTALTQLGRIAGNIGGTLSGIFTAAQSAGADFLGTVERITAEVRNFVNSAQGQETITNLFRAIREAVDAAMPGVKALVTAVSEVINKIGETGAVTKLGQAFSALAESVGPVASTLANLVVSAIGPLATALAAIAPVAGPVAAGLLGIAAAGKAMTIFEKVSGHLSGFVGKMREVDGAGSKLKLALSGVTSMAGGPLGVALGAAGVALGILAQHQADAAAKAAEHRAALDSLAGTLDKYSGAVTQATINEKASQLAKDGTLRKVKDLGVATDDYVRASLGEAGALERVQAQLAAHTRGLIEADRGYQANRQTLERYGITLNDLAGYAAGLAPETERVRAGLAGIADPMLQHDMGLLVGKIRDMGAPTAELARELNITSGEFQKIQEETRLAAEASGDFASKLDFLKQGLAGIATGAPQTEIMKNGLVGLGQAAGEAAARAGDAAAAVNGVAAGAAAAEQAMAQSRDAFIQAATAAGLTEQQAGALADQIGLIPAAARTIFETNATGVTAEMITLNAQFDAVPGAKTVTVQALTTEAVGQLQALGFQVEQLPDGTFKVTAQTETAQAQLDAFLAGAANASAEVQVGANKMPAEQALQAILAAIGAGAETVTINGQSMPAQQALAFVLGAIGQGSATVTINGQSFPAEQVLSAYLGAVNKGSGTVTINGQSFPADQVLDAFLGRTDKSSATSTVNANAGPANAAVDGWQSRTNSTVGTATAKANTGDAEAALNHTARPRTATITVNTVPGRLAGPIGSLAQGGVLAPMADGGVLGATSTGHPTVAFAGGGRWGSLDGHRLRPMPARAALVPPNTWRVVGDNMRVPEVYAPLDGSARSLSFLRYGANAFGYDLIKRAATTVNNAMSGSGISRVAVMPPQAEAQRLRDLIPVDVSAAIARAQAAAAAARPALDQAGVEQRLDQLLTLLERRGAGASITVEDRSGDPAETARSTMLALRLS
ncbi:hypothetical protein ACFQE5_22350 [Pseudonocardia hispaniensis]|uniref:Tape measure protein n=1 Tax=Pseudonocardia hispaniensis TaxID=904933 RepID=A0ABW1J7U7_9PSEU